MIDWLPTDKEYLFVEPEEVESLMFNFADPSNRYIPFVWECEEIAMSFVVDVRRERRNNIESIAVEERRNLALGEALGTKWAGKNKSHHANIFIATDGVYLADLQKRKIWKAEKGKDEMFFVRM